MNHPDFRIAGKIFASLGYPDDEHAMVKLTPEQQQLFLKKAPKVFTPCAGVWGERGATSVSLSFPSGKTSANEHHTYGVFGLSHSMMANSAFGTWFESTTRFMGRVTGSRKRRRKRKIKNKVRCD